MKFNYNLEINNILNKIYNKKIFDLGNEIENFIIDLLPKDKEGYFFRCNVSKYKNNYYPKIYDNLGNKL